MRLLREELARKELGCVAESARVREARQDAR